MPQGVSSNSASTVSFATPQEIIINKDDDSIGVYGTDGGTQRQLKTDSSGELQIDVLSSALPSGAATSAKQDTGNTSLSSIDGKITAVNTGAVVISSSALPSGAATAAKQPALGVAGTASTDVITIQGISGATPVKVDGSAVTQPVSGTVTANPGGSSTATVTQTAVSTSAVTVLAANANRICHASVQNTSLTRILYIRIGGLNPTSGSTGIWTAALAPATSTTPGGYYETPGPRVYTGAIIGIWDGADASGYSNATEITS